MRYIRVSCSWNLLHGGRVGSDAPTAQHDESVGVEGTIDAADLLTDCWKALGERSTETSDPGTARLEAKGTVCGWKKVQ